MAFTVTNHAITAIHALIAPTRLGRVVPRGSPDRPSVWSWTLNPAAMILGVPSGAA